MREDGGAPLIVVVRLGSALRPHAGGATTVEVDVDSVAAGGSVTVGAVLDALAALHPAVGRRVRDEAGAVRLHVNVFVGSDNVRMGAGDATVVPPGQEVALLPAVSGG